MASKKPRQQGQSGDMASSKPASGSTDTSANVHLGLEFLLKAAEAAADGDGSASRVTGNAASQAALVSSAPSSVSSSPSTKDALAFAHWPPSTPPLTPQSTPPASPRVSPTLSVDSGREDTFAVFLERRYHIGEQVWARDQGQKWFHCRVTAVNSDGSYTVDLQTPASSPSAVSVSPPSEQLRCGSGHDIDSQSSTTGPAMTPGSMRNGMQRRPEDLRPYADDMLGSSRSGYVCKFCGKIIKQKVAALAFFAVSNINGLQGLVRHTGLPPSLLKHSLFCHSTDRSCSTSTGNLTVHMRIHTGQKPFVCKFCGKSFNQKTNLNCHERKHTKERPFKCRICDKTFSQLAHRTTHERTHTGVKPFVCHFCGKTFSQKGNHSVHLRVHTGERPFVCRHCGKGFVKSSDLHTHLKNVHGRLSKLSCLCCRMNFADEVTLSRHLDQSRVPGSGPAVPMSSAGEAAERIPEPPHGRRDTILYACPCGAELDDTVAASRHMHQHNITMDRAAMIAIKKFRLHTRTALSAEEAVTVNRLLRGWPSNIRISNNGGLFLVSEQASEAPAALAANAIVAAAVGVPQHNEAAPDQPAANGHIDIPLRIPDHEQVHIIHMAFPAPWDQGVTAADGAEESNNKGDANNTLTTLLALSSKPIAPTEAERVVLVRAEICSLSCQVLDIASPPKGRWCQQCFATRTRLSK